MGNSGVLKWEDFQRIVVERGGSDVVVEISHSLLARNADLISYVTRVVTRAPGSWPRSLLISAEGERVYLPVKECLQPGADEVQLKDFMLRMFPDMGLRDLRGLQPCADEAQLRDFMLRAFPDIHLPDQLCSQPGADVDPLMDLIQALGRRMLPIADAKKQDLMKTCIVIPDWWFEKTATMGDRASGASGSTRPSAVRMLAYVFYYCLKHECPDFLEGVSKSDFMQAVDTQ